MDDEESRIATVLAPLRNPPDPPAWLSADALRHRAARRHRRRMAGRVASGLAVGTAMALLAAFVVVPGSGPSEPARTAGGAGQAVRSVAGPGGSVHLLASGSRMSPPSSSTVAGLAQSEQSFALGLTRQELSASQGANVLLSPMSAGIDLSMLELGAAGRTEAEIAAATSSSDLSAARNAAAWKALVSSEIAGAAPHELRLANSLWLETHLHVEAAFLRQEAASFGNKTYQVDFTSPSATSAINTWVSGATAGRISELFSPGELQPTTLVVLANAIHLHAAWADPHQFAPTTGTFVTADGQPISVPMLTARDDRLRSRVTPAYQAVQIPYANGRFAALVIEPTPGTMASWLAGLSAKELSAIVGSLTGGMVTLSMPSLDLSSRPMLNTALSALGMAGAFGSADLTPMLGPTLGHQVAVGVVQQAAALKVNRWGTDAAAATGISVVPTSAGPGRQIAVDHPYLFLVRDTKTGAIVFSSVVNDPARS